MIFLLYFLVFLCYYFIQEKQSAAAEKKIWYFGGVEFGVKGDQIEFKITR